MSTTPLWLTQEVVEAFTAGSPAVNLTQEIIEAFAQASPPVYLTQEMVEVWLGGHSPIRLTQAVVEVWYTPRVVHGGCLVPLLAATGEDESPCPE